MSTLPSTRFEVRRRGNCFVCKTRPWLIGIHLAPHLDKARHVCPGSGEVAA